jgi:hypothetical protein
MIRLYKPKCRDPDNAIAHGAAMYHAFKLGLFVLDDDNRTGTKEIVTNVVPIGLGVISYICIGFQKLTCLGQEKWMVALNERITTA